MREAGAAVRCRPPDDADGVPLSTVSAHRAEGGIADAASLTLEELARLQGATTVSDVSELLADVWDSDEELDAFLADLRASRCSSLA